MSTYPYECRACNLAFEIEMRMSEYDSKTVTPCPSCSSRDTVRIFTVPQIAFHGDDWATKNGRVQGQMRRKNERLALKERDMKGDRTLPSLVPNVGGEQVASWSDAAKLARDQGRDSSGYEQLAKKETS